MPSATIPQYPNEESVYHAEFAQKLDAEDPLRGFREKFIIPTKADLKRKTLRTTSKSEEGPSETCTYLCGNSLGCQPKNVRDFIDDQLTRWSTKAVTGHFGEIPDCKVPSWLDIDESAAKLAAHIVGARQSEVAVMQTLTANLHLLLASFYRPTTDRYKIIIEAKAFPSDTMCVTSQLLHHKQDPEKALVLVEPPSKESLLIPTEHILSVIDAHADSTALIMLPGVQYYTGQFFDIPKITAYAQQKGIVVGWDLAHAVGNVPLQMHDWNVDFAAWCSYKYLNSGPGASGGLFVHDRHTPGSPANGVDGVVRVVDEADSKVGYRRRLAGWWGSDKSTRFNMTGEFNPTPGASGFQLSNPSAIDLSSVLASLTVFAETDIPTLRAKSLKATGYLEHLLLADPSLTPHIGSHRPFKIITPSNPDERGAQLSILLDDGILEPIMEELNNEGVILDERKPNVLRVAPAPLYNTFEDVRRFVEVFLKACQRTAATSNGNGEAK